jgi:hypothetical protein
MQGRAGAMSKRTYLTFPINILKGGMKDIKICMNDAMHYCLYYQYLKEKNNGSMYPLESAQSKFILMPFADIEKSFKTGKVIYESIPKNAPLTSISMDMAIDFGINEKTEFEIACFLAFAAIKSIIQKQVYKKITNDFLLSRMSGNSKGKAEIDPSLKPFKRRYQLDKIKLELQLYWGLKYYAKRMRGFYVSFKMSPEILAMKAIMNSRANRIKELKQKKSAANLKAEEQVRKLHEFQQLYSNDISNNTT